MASKYGVLAVSKKDHLLTVVTNDPLNFYGLEDIRQLTGMELQVLLSELAPLTRAMDYYYSEVGARAAAKNANQSSQSEVEELALEVIRRLKKEYPDAGCTLDYDQAWKLLVSVRLAAQCTDAG